jgi:hypothetical protein
MMIEFEHNLFIVLLLAAILNAKPPRPRWAALGVLVGVLLIFIPPSHPLLLPWNIILGLSLPLLLWQNVSRITNADWRGPKSFILWMVAMTLIAAALWLGGALQWPGALLLGMVAASIIWRAGESEFEASYMSQVGPVAIIFLLIEVEAALQSPDQYIGGIFSGMFFGAVFALLGLSIIRRLPEKWHSLIGVGQVYIAYWLSFTTGVSAVSAAFVSVLIYFWLNRFFKLGLHEKAPPAPLNTWPGFIGIVGLFLLLGWEGHQSISTLILIEVLIGSFVGLAITWLGRRWMIPAFEADKSIWFTAIRVFILIFTTLLIWPRDLIRSPIQLAVAIGIAVIVIGSSFIALEFYFPRGTDQTNNKIHS